MDWTEPASSARYAGLRGCPEIALVFVRLFDVFCATLRFDLLGPASEGMQAHSPMLDVPQGLEEDRIGVFSRAARRGRGITTSLALFLLALPMARIHAQMPATGGEPSQNPYSLGAQTPSSPDCADPLMAASSACTSALSGGALYGGSLYGAGSQSNAIPAQGGNPTANNPNRNYTDIEQLSPYNQPQSQVKPTPLPPEPLTEFQKFIASSTGQILPVFGANLFRNVPSTFAPLNMTPVPP